MLRVCVVLVTMVAVLVVAAPASAHRELQSIPLVWKRIADCESGDGDGRPPYRASWHTDGYFDGGLQFLPSTWAMATKLYRHGSTRYRYAYQAPPIVQVRVANRWLKATSWLQWPACSAKIGVR